MAANVLQNGSYKALVAELLGIGIVWIVHALTIGCQGSAVTCDRI
jgi:hypothetical protein